MSYYRKIHDTANYLKSIVNNTILGLKKNKIKGNTSSSHLKRNKMKTFNYTSIVVVVFMTLFSITSNAQIAKAEIQATGLTCSMCSNAINKQLKSLADVQDVAIDLNTNTFTVTLKDNNSLKPSVFKENVEKAGFFIGSLILTMKPETIAQKPYVVLDGKLRTDKIVQVQILDKGYVTDKTFKKLSKSYKNSTTYTANSESDFHVKIVN
jgi:copper chaperone CopZ